MAAAAKLARSILGRRGQAKRSTRRARIVRTLVALVLAPILAVVVRAVTLPMPEPLRAPSETGTEDSVVYTDRSGVVLRELRGREHARALTLTSREMGPLVLAAIVSAEDARFAHHPGVDPLAAIRALGSLVRHRRIVSGASTLTMQLARLVVPHRRSFLGKLGEAALALRIERGLSKARILEEYANRAPFGAEVRGVGAASRIYFDKPPCDLSAAEAATLAALPRGPTLYSVQKRPELVLRRRDRVLARMRENGALDEDTFRRALAEPLAPRIGKPAFGAPHLVAALAAGGEGLSGGLDVVHAQRVTLTVDAELQREAESLVRGAVRPLEGRHVTSASVVVIDNATGEILAYVGSPSFDDAKALGQNDGVRALRQPGSTLKPFVYALGMERLGLTGASVLADVELSVEVPSGVYRPMNYDERFHGPVRLREALGSSYNVPAVAVTLKLGEDTLLTRLREVGFASLDKDSATYGPALALGDGEVRLLDLANAYAMLARGGVTLPTSAVRRIEDGHGRATDRAMPEPTRVFARVVTAQIADILRDKAARVPAFGERSALDLPFEVAVKTGTSKGFRDNFAVGFTDRVTVAVWVGNFDGTPMQGVSGVTGAAPIFHEIMLAAMRGHETDRLGAATAPSLHDVAVCSLSGGTPHEGCRHTARERLPDSARPEVCKMHEVVAVDTRNGLLATPSCPSGVVLKKTVEVYPQELESWARAAFRPVGPVDVSPLCGGSGSFPRVGHLQISSPRDGARYVTDPDRPLALQTVPVRIEGTTGAKMRLVLDGAVVTSGRVGDALSFRLAPGEHVLVAEEESGTKSAPVRVRVD